MKDIKTTRLISLYLGFICVFVNSEILSALIHEMSANNYAITNIIVFFVCMVGWLYLTLRLLFTDVVGEEIKRLKAFNKKLEEKFPSKYVRKRWTEEELNPKTRLEKFEEQINNKS